MKNKGFPAVSVATSKTSKFQWSMDSIISCSCFSSLLFMPARPLPLIVAVAIMPGPSPWP